MENHPETKIKVAKLGMIQAIIVSCITAAAGVATGYIARGELPSQKEPNQHWLVIKEVTSNEHSVVRVVATVNGVNYSYPSKVLWAEIGPGMSSERFPLPLTNDGYRVSFSAFVSDKGPEVPVVVFGSNEIEEVSKTLLPVKSKSFSLYQLAGSYRAAVKDVSIVYEIE